MGRRRGNAWLPEKSRIPHPPQSLHPHDRLLIMCLCGVTLFKKGIFRFLVEQKEKRRREAAAFLKRRFGLPLPLLLLLASSAPFFQSRSSQENILLTHNRSSRLFVRCYFCSHSLLPTASSFLYLSFLQNSSSNKGQIGSESVPNTHSHTLTHSLTLSHLSLSFSYDYS